MHTGTCCRPLSFSLEPLPKRQRGRSRVKPHEGTKPAPRHASLRARRGPVSVSQLIDESKSTPAAESIVRKNQPIDTAKEANGTGDQQELTAPS